MNILVTGANGQLGSEIRKLVTNSVKNTYFFTDTTDLDITNLKKVASFVVDNQVDIIVNCAAYTQVDKAEDNVTAADLVNHMAVANLAKVCKQQGVKLIHISTDYVFSGSKNRPYTEQDAEQPLGVYGRTKFDGEQAIRTEGIPHLIIRTSWLYSSFGHNFVKTIQKLSAERTELKVVFDQVGTPTYAADLAEFILYVIENDLFKNKQETYHFSNEGVCSWFDFATEIVRLSGNECKVTPCLSDEFPAKVKRPHYSVLDKSKLKNDFQYAVPHWKKSLEKMLTSG
ncbi:dTDP-4-dehydrorhamnose reductase [Capnocytophaga sp.]|uniref:dTDP-4-dehydrorhamnose reductase n=1 Tax=Capnocytophaga sp. TaxID=44737 RepID=UPI0026DC262D|nr:dTDP-4-dehydrorhamnose reductase [Capnocytophaga sp.]MDO5104430.1 dTDP-4-dehydrorhamnose reductase [Capnocytophaga sp.]